MELLSATPFVLVLVATALVFDFLNGLHDSANSIATIVSTRVLAPRYAVLWAAFFNFVAFLVFGLHVAGTVGSGIVGVESLTIGWSSQRWAAPSFGTSRPGGSASRRAVRMP